MGTNVPKLVEAIAVAFEHVGGVPRRLQRRVKRSFEIRKACFACNKQTMRRCVLPRKLPVVPFN